MAPNLQDLRQGVADACGPEPEPGHSDKGCGLYVMQLQPLSHTVTASITYHYSLNYLRLQPPLPTVTASITHGYSLNDIRLQATTRREVPDTPLFTRTLHQTPFERSKLGCLVKQVGERIV